MDLGGLFHGIGDFLGGIFGGNKKQQNKPQQSAPRPAAAPIQHTVQQVNNQAPQQNTVKLPDPFALPTPAQQSLVMGGVTQHPTQAPAPARPTVAMPTNPFPLSSQALQQQFQAQRQQEATNVATPLAADPMRDRLAHAAQKSTSDTLDLINSNPVTSFLASIPQNVVKSGLHLANDFGANIGTNITDPITRKLLNLPDGNIGDTRSGGNETATSIDGIFGDGKGNGLSTAPQPVKDVLGIGSDVLNLLPGAALLKPVREAVVNGIDALSGVNKAKEAAILAKDPTSSITATPNTGKAPAITSPNRPAPTAAAPAPTVEAPLGRGNAAPTSPVFANPTLTAAKGDTQATAAEQALARDGAPQVTKPAPIATPPVKPVEAPVAAGPTGELGTITRNAVADGSINTPEGIASVVANTETAARAAAKDAGDSLENIIKKGQIAHDKSVGGKDLTPAEAEAQIKGFTKAQQDVYKNYSQEIGTLRDRSGYSLKGGHQGAWYGPRQALDEVGNSAEYNPLLVNEIRRNTNGSGLHTSELDLSPTPYSHAIQRYADAPEAGSQMMIDRVENTADGTSRGIKVPDAAKTQLKEDLTNVTNKRDEALRLQKAGDMKGARKMSREVENEINNTFKKFADNIPEGKGRGQALADLRKMRDPYMQSSMESLALSNVVNRVADQGSALLYKAQQPIRRQLDKALSGHYAKQAATVNPDSVALNTSKEAIQAAKETAKGTLSSEIGSNFKANMSLAGAGRNPLVKGIAKIDALPRAVTSAATQAGDISTPNLIKALQVGASHDAAKGLKTVADYKQYFADYMKTDQFKQDLEHVNSDNNSRLGLAGNTGKGDGGKISKVLSKYVDNGIKTAAEATDKKFGTHLGNNRLVNEANGYVKSNITGFAGVGSRILGFTGRSATGKGLFEAAKVAKSGAPDAAARATQLASQSIMDATALYGTAGAAALAAKSGGGIIGYTGAGAKAGSSDSAYNKSNSIPRDKWYINLPGGNRVYFDPARALGAPGAAADIIGGALTGDPGTGAEDAATQVFNQVGGSSIPQSIVNFQTAFDPSQPDQNKKYAGQQIQQTLAPATGIFNNAANLMDPTKRAPTNFFDDLKSNLPGLRTQVPAAKDSQGNVLPNTEQFTGGSSMVQIAKNPDAPLSANSTNGPSALDAEITRLQKISGDVFPTSANTNASDAGVKDLAGSLVNDPVYTKADDKTKASMLKGVLAGTSTKDIDPSLSTEDKQALLDHTVLGKKAPVWLEDNKNAASYYTADYNNQKASGTLTEAGDDITNPSGAHYKAVAAQVDQSYGTTYQMKKDYSATSQSELKSLLDPKSDSYDPDAAQKLYDYDQARVKAGLPAKYNVDKIKAQFDKAAAAGNKAPKSFSFANLPTSLVGTGAGTGSTSNYAKPESLYQPIASLKTPAVAAIPQGRTISVSKV